jgi:DNA-directed RNA polymerase I, II, and III subunit RPABC2
MAPKKAIPTTEPAVDKVIAVDSKDIDESDKTTKKPVPIIKKKQTVAAAVAPTEEPVAAPSIPKITKKVQIQPKKTETVAATTDEPEAADTNTNTKEDEILLDASKLSKNKKNSNKKSDESSHKESNDLFNEEDVDFRTVLLNYDFSKNKTPAKITKYEKALLIGKRAKQIEEGANPNVKVLPGQSAIEIAEEELRQRKIPLIIKRPLGNTFEYWRPRDMEVLMD